MTIAAKIAHMALFAVLLATLLAVAAPDASAHAQLVKSDPAQRATIAEAPTQLRLWFNEEIEGAYASLNVKNGSGDSVTDAKPTVPDDDPKSLVLALPALQPGKYTVDYRVLSIDGHVVESSYDFTVTGAPAEN